ncbi:FtsX-like permease family protein [Lacisediminimonas profundi]|uniref:FtsX-like permease family protein n=1 Tax=Lacisediminimonas profundi TaxID=2603856 RepID=UPI00124B56B9|nr:FtsX-like permease family protein [Lacisediminimonas profundi]
MKASLLTRWLLLGELRAHPVRSLVALAAIALGVALGFAIHLINAAAFNEFSAAIKTVSGTADLQVRGAQPFFDEQAYPRLARMAGIGQASPVLEVDAALADAKGTLKIVATDIFRSAAIAPDLIGVPAADRPFDGLMDDTVFLSPAALEWLQRGTGDSLALRVGSETVTLRIAGTLTRARAGQRLAVMDLGAAQWRLGRLGQLSRIDLRLEPGVDREQFRARLQRELGNKLGNEPGNTLLVTEAKDQEDRTARMSRAYRVNLNVLALVALFTGAFLVFSTQALSVIRRRSNFALLRVMGWTRRQLIRQVLLEGALLGVAGSLLGLAAGYAMAAAALHFFGGDLGGGYFPGVRPQPVFSIAAALVFFCAGTGVALLGSAAPAWEAARARLAPALKAGSEDSALARLATPWPGLACLLAGALLTQMPPVADLPIYGYLAVALLLIGAIALMPRMAAAVFARLAAWPRRAVPMLALNRLANAPNQASIALGGVLSSFSLMVAMAIMVSSFRVSVDDWLRHLLAADLYVRSSGGESALLGPQQQKLIAGVPGIAQAGFQRVTQLVLDPARPSVAVIARLIDDADPGKSLPLTGKQLDGLAPGAVPIWASEAMVDLYGYQVGQSVTLPLGQGNEKFVVAGIWRDYARQTGAIQMRLPDYQRITGEQQVNDAALWLLRDAKMEAVQAGLRALPFGATLELTAPAEIRAISLRIFDRSFAVTYLLEAVAIMIGLFGIAATFSAQALARAREFGMLRHIGFTRRQILHLLAAEGLLLTAIGVTVGFVLGWCISLILIFIVNPQSFHWTMQLHMPWGLLGAVTAVLLASAAVTALASGRLAVAGSAVRAVREDW